MDKQKTGNKRRHSSDHETQVNCWPRFLVMEREEGTFERTSFILIHRGIVGMAGEPKTLKKIGLNKFLIETTKESHSTSLLKTTKIANINVKITPHNSLNSKKGVIKCPDLKYSPEEEILAELKHADVSSVKKSPL